MNRKFIVVVAGLLFVLLVAAWSHAGGVFVATAKNARGALYQGFGPTRAMLQKWPWLSAPRIPLYRQVAR